MTDLPVRTMVLYKHGVGFFVREGQFNGENLTLTFKADEINDVLKSLAVFDHAGGQILGIHYQTPMDHAARMQNTSINLSEQHTLADLLRNLRGRVATLTYELSPRSLETVTGRVMGLDYVTEREHQLGVVNVSPEEMRVTVITSDGRIYSHFFNHLRTIEIADPQSNRDLIYFLDTSMTEDNRRSVNVRLSAGDHDLSVYYVAPSPTWRVSYRLVAESDETAAGEPSTGSALLQGWGLFDNRLDEDLTDVQVTLVAGQPISFIYDLYESRIPQRPTVKDESRIAPGPIEYAGFAADEEDSLDDVRVAFKERRAASGGGAFAQGVAARSAAPMAAPPPARSMTRQAAVEAAQSSAETKETGETFQYIVTTPVTVKRGESALVPIIASEVKYERELLYNSAKLLNHPVAALRFSNSSGLTLERGPVTVVEDGDYKGEAVIPFTKDGNEVYVPYAVELGVRVTETPTAHKTETFGLSFEKGLMIFDHFDIRGTSYKLENSTAKPVTVTLEVAALGSNWELFETPPPDVSSAREQRWRVAVPARGKAEFVYKIRQRTSRTQHLQDLKFHQLQQFLQNRWLDQETFDQLKTLLENYAAIQSAVELQQKLEVERDKIYEQQEQLRKNLGALQATGKEAELRDRMLDQLKTTQDRLDEIERELAEAQHRQAAAQAQTEQIIAALG